jgi:anti-sigma factor ChrR (cupin superfamily)
MLKCRDVAERANDYIDKELSWHTAMAMGFHLFMCKHCSGFVRKLKLVIAMVRERPPETISEDDAEYIVSSVLVRQAQPDSEEQ